MAQSCIRQLFDYSPGFRDILIDICLCLVGWLCVGQEEEGERGCCQEKEEKWAMEAALEII